MPRTLLLSLVTALTLSLWYLWPAAQATTAAPTAITTPPPVLAFSAATAIPARPPQQTAAAQRLAALRAVLAGQRSLLDLQAEVRRACKPACPNWPEGELGALSPQEAHLLRRALAAHPTLDRAVSELVQDSQAPLAERLARINTARQQIAGTEVTQLLYGEQQAQIAFKAAAQSFLTGPAASLPPAARQQALDALQRQHYGSYYDHLVAQQAPAEKLHWVLAAAELGLNPAQRDAIRLQLRTQYLGADLARQLAAQDADDARHQLQAQGYQAARAALETALRQRGDPSRDPVLAAEWEAGLAALRQQWFR
ncbi:lipase secretion chaperone [Chitinimonas sp. JJ19]|uniref:lipase secretion chaperone n=1 Tax=Chitinimonas sp. JJ19 TaxID=3109352 RepID=UPI0030033814